MSRCPSCSAYPGSDHHPECAFTKKRGMSEINRLRAEVERLKENQITAEAIQRVAELHRECDRLRTEVEALKEWRPIDTAPQDGSLLLLGWWRTWPEVEWECEVKAAGNMDTGRRGTRWMHGQATHWMPLPKPPALRGEGEK